MARLFLALAIAGCSYRPGSYDFAFHRFPGARVVVNCLDVAVARRYDVHGGAPVVEYSFGNRCDRHVDVDLATVRVVGHDETGHDVALAAFDPRREIRVQPIDALIAGNEQIEYSADQRIVGLCVDIGGIDASAPRTERWVCLDDPPEVTR